MKKLGVIAIFVFGITVSVNAQEGFAVKAGFNNVSAKVDLGAFGGNVTNSEFGFYVGGGYNFELDDTWSLEPSALLSIVSDLTSLYIPIMAKYEVAESFTIQAGPQINYLLEDVPDGAFGLDLAIGAGYQIDDNWFVEARYGFEISRGGDFGDSVDYNTFTFGAGYRFN
jgi:opacity protein-like surface antigen